MSRALALVATASLATACHRKSGPPAELAGLAAVPATAQVVISLDIPRISAAPLVTRAVDQLLLRDAGLAAEWQKLHETCKLDPADLKHLVIAIQGVAAGGSAQASAPALGPVLIVATGKLAEIDLATCVRGLVGRGSGSLVTTDVSGRTVYHAKDGNHQMFFAFSRADTVVASPSEPLLLDALGAGKKVLDDPDMKRWIDLADQKAPIWAAGRVNDRVRQGALRMSGGHLQAGPAAYAVSFDPTSGAKLDMRVVMATADDAKTLESLLNGNKGLLAYVAQQKGLGRLVSKVSITTERETIHVHVDLDTDDINQAISALDGGGSAAQESPPPTGSGSSGSGSSGP